MPGQPTELLLFDFTAAEADNDWHAIDDRIMGGCSQSRPQLTPEGCLRFAGEVSLENNGGFASIRSASHACDLRAYSGLRLRVRGDGRRYKLSLRTDSFFDGISYQAGFATTPGEWQELELPFARLAPTHHGIALTSASPLDPSQVQSFGLFIAERQAGPFQLDIAWIKAFR